MNARQFTLLCTTTVLLVVTLTASAHHSVSAEFDGNRRIVLTGTITKVSWLNPHAFFYVDVRDPKGKVVNWACELGSPNMLHALGWTQTTLKAGMTVSFTATLARDGSHKVIARGIVADGTKLAAWPSEHINP